MLSSASATGCRPDPTFVPWPEAQAGELAFVVSAGADRVNAFYGPYSADHALALPPPPAAEREFWD